MSEVKRTWSVPTSPRSPYKLPEELNLLKDFEGKIWDKETQKLYAVALSKSEFFEGSVSSRYPDFSARDRINRSPKTFGFVRFDDSRKIVITSAGKGLIENKHTEELFLRQLLKWQYPSPNHNGVGYEHFRIKPFLELLRLAFELGGLSKRELAIFCVPFINYRDYDHVKQSIVEFRAQSSQLSAPQRKKFIIAKHLEQCGQLYAAEISSGAFLVRQRRGVDATAEDFIKTKMRNSLDYADAAIRYFRATGLFRLSATTFRIQTMESKAGLIQEILKSTPREPLRFEDESGFLDFLGDSNLPILPDDRPEVLQAEIADLIGQISAHAIASKEKLDSYRNEKLVSASAAELKIKRSELEKILLNDLINIQASTLRSYSEYEDIVKMYDKITSRTDYDVPDKPLFFEWNTWRAFTMLNDGDIVSNSLLDKEGKPLSTARGGVSDGIGYYKDFVMTIEVTLTRGERQFEAEHESVPRHVGRVFQNLRQASDERPVYGFFIASGLNPSTIANFYMLRRTNVTHYGGVAKVVPMDLKDFKEMLSVARTAGGVKAEQIFRFLLWIDDAAQKAQDEQQWYLAIQQKIPTWNTC